MDNDKPTQSDLDHARAQSRTFARNNRIQVSKIGTGQIATGKIETQAQAQQREYEDSIAAKGREATRIPEQSPSGVQAIDFTSAHTNAPGIGGAGIADFLFIWRDDTETTLNLAIVVADYAPDPNTPATLNWSIKIPVIDGALVKDPEDATNPWTYDTGTDLFNDTTNPDDDPVVPQAYYRIIIYRAGKLQCSGGNFQEDIYCNIAHGPITRLIKIG